MRALTLTQPWASLVILGLKKFETRSWATTYRGPLLIHAAKGFPSWARKLCSEYPWRLALDQLQVQRAEDLPRGAILGAVVLQDCRSTSAKLLMPLEGLSPQELALGDYNPDRWIWELADPEAFPVPIPCKGALSLWAIPDGEVLEQIHTQITQLQRAAQVRDGQGGGETPRGLARL